MIAFVIGLVGRGRLPGRARVWCGFMGNMGGGVNLGAFVIGLKGVGQLPSAARIWRGSMGDRSRGLSNSLSEKWTSDANEKATP